MSEYIRKLNTADTLALLYKHGLLSAIDLLEALAKDGFYDVLINPETKEVSAKHEIVRFQLGVS